MSRPEGKNIAHCLVHLHITSLLTRQIRIQKTIDLQLLIQAAAPCPLVIPEPIILGEIKQCVESDQGVVCYRGK